MLVIIELAGSLASATDLHAFLDVARVPTLWCHSVVANAVFYMGNKNRVLRYFAFQV